MNRKNSQDRDGHPPADILLLHLEGELDGLAANTVQTHVEQCLECRLACQQLEMGMARFTAFCDSVAVPARAPNVDALHERLMEAAEGSTPSLVSRLGGLFRIGSSRRLVFASGGVAVCLIVWIAFFLSSPRQSVYASQILDDARSASDSLISHAKVLNQRIRLRRGSMVVERSVHHGRQATIPAKGSKIDPQLQQELDLAKINLDDPLNANDFAQWRAAQPEHTDSVKETSQSVTITTRVTGSTITEGTLTLSRSGWRPIARSVELRGEAPIEISEVSYDISDSSSPNPPSAIGALRPIGDASIANPAAAPEVSRDELEASELDLREALHSMGADVSAAPAIWRTGQTVLIYASAEKPAEMAEIRAAARRIPHVEESNKPPAPLTESAQTIAQSGPYVTTPPLAAALEARLGDAQSMHAYLESMQTRSAHVLAEAAALDQLGKRYAPGTIKTLPLDLRTRVNRLAASMLSSLQRDSGDYVKSVSPTLDDMAHDLNVAAPKDDGANLPGCLSWQQNAALAAPQLREFTRDVSLLFVPNKTEKPTEVAAEPVLSDSLRARSFLELHLMSTCQLFGAN